ncbi:MAG: prolyl-tRNA synthetase associated domain-containing protein [Pseudomonadota bacterium]
MTSNNIDIIKEPIDQGLDLPTSPQQLLERFESLEINYELYHHEAVFTVAESEKIDANIPGTHCRNLYFRDKKKNNYLLVLQNATDVDIKKLPEILGAGRLSFGSADRLWEFLGVRPGSVCPFAIVNDIDQAVKIFLDQSMMETDMVNYHPLLNTMTVSLSPADLIKFIESTGHEVHIVDLSSAKPEEQAA